MSWCRLSSSCLSTVVQIVTHVACLFTISTCVAFALPFAPFIVCASAAFQLSRPIQASALGLVSLYGRQTCGMLAILVIFQTRLLPICTRDLATLVQYQCDVMFKTLSCYIHVHSESVLVDQTVPMFVMFYSYSSVAQTTHHD